MSEGGADDPQESVHRGADHFGGPPRRGGDTGRRVCCMVGVREATFYRWQNRLGSFGVREIRDLGQRRDESRKLIWLVEI